MSSGQLKKYKIKIQVSWLITQFIENKIIMKNLESISDDELINALSWDEDKYDAKTIAIYESEAIKRNLDEKLKATRYTKKSLDTFQKDSNNFDSLDFVTQNMNLDTEANSLLKKEYDKFKDGYDEKIKKEINQVNKQIETKSGILIMIGVLLFIIGIIATSGSKGEIIFVGAIISGISLFISGIAIYQRKISQ